MAIKYKLVEKGNPQNPESPKKYFALAKSSGDVSLRELSRQIAKISTVSPIDIIAVLEALIMVIPDNLMDGKIVRLGDFGSFSVKLGSIGEDEAENFSSKDITNAALKFRAGKEVVKMLMGADYEKVD